MGNDYAWAEAAARLFEPTPPSPWKTAGQLAQAIDPRVRQTPALDLIDQALLDVEEGRCDRLIVSMPPQEGKSSRVTTMGPLWFLLRNPNRRIAIVSYGRSLAEEFGREIRKNITNNQGHEATLDLGVRIARDNGSVSSWKIEGRQGGVRSVGMSGGLTGRPADALFIDDPISNAEQADSETFRERHWQWWLTVGSTRLAPGAPVILVLTRWHEDDLAGRLLAAEDGHRWRVVSIPAQCEDPETDPLGRELGEFMESARVSVNEQTGEVTKRDREQWLKIKATQSTRSWSALYQQNPTPAEGAVWKSDWIDGNRGVSGDWITHRQRCIVSVDPAATSTKSSDYTGIIITGLDSEGTGWVLDDRTLKGTPLEWGGAVWQAVCDWQADEIVIEDNQGGEMVVEVLASSWKEHLRDCHKRHNLPPPVARVHATQSKRTRAESVAVFHEKGRVRHAADGTDRLEKLEKQMLSWTGDGKSPDRIDALVHGLTRLFLRQHSTGGMQAARTQNRWAGMRR